DGVDVLHYECGMLARALADGVDGDVDFDIAVLEPLRGPGFEGFGLLDAVEPEDIFIEVTGGRLRARWNADLHVIDVTAARLHQRSSSAAMMLSDPRTATTSLIMWPSIILGRIDRWMKEGGRVRARQGMGPPSLTR